MRQYTPEQIQYMRDAYTASGANLTAAERMLKRDHGFRPDRRDLVEYWEPLGYVSPGTGGRRVSKNDKRYTTYEISPEVKKRLIDAFHLAEELADPPNHKELARRFGIPKQVVSDILREEQEKSSNSIPLEGRLR